MARKRIDYSKPTDKDQEEYRKYFGIVDKFLIQQEHDENKTDDKDGFIVYIDLEDDIDWIDYRYWDAEEKKKRDGWLAKLNVLESEPCTNISEENKVTFKKLVGSAYLLAFQKQFDHIEEIMIAARKYVIARNKEVARSLFLEFTGVVAVIFLALLVIDVTSIKWQTTWVTGTIMGILGAYVSIWLRYGKLSMTGLSSRWLHYLESLSRLLIGAIFAIVAMCAVKCGLILSQQDPDLAKYTFAIVGFAAGFSERFVPSMIEKFVSQNTDDDNK